MSKVDELIQQLYPEGVEFSRLVDITLSIRTGLNPRKNFKLNTESASNYYVTVKEITSGKIRFSDKTDRINSQAIEIIQKRSKLEKDDILFSGIGTIGKVALVDIPTTNWNCSESLFLIKPDRKAILPKFLLYILGSDVAKNQYIGQSVGSTLKGVRMSTLFELSIPVPPLPIQQEIVSILDKFTQLEAELEAELEARKKQYNFYRDQLLSFEGKEVEWKTLGEVVTLKRGVRVVKSQLNEVGEFPVYQNSLKPLGYFNNANNNANTTFVITAGAAGEVGYSPVSFWAADDCFSLICPVNLQNKFLYYFLKVRQTTLLSRVRRASVPRLSRNVIEKLKIPIPPLEEQERIVNILDKFDALVNDISVGLPAEIASRRKQYEYYREQLLTFKS